MRSVPARASTVVATAGIAVISASLGGAFRRAAERLNSEPPPKIFSEPPRSYQPPPEEDLPPYPTGSGG